MNNSRLVAYIDESGCSGDKFGSGSSEFLVIAAAVFRRDDAPHVTNLFAEARDERGREKPFLKFSKSSDADNFVLTKLLAKKRVRIVQVALHKPSMVGTFTRNHHQEEYQYLCKFVIERISWIARDSANLKLEPHTTCQLVFSQQSMYSYDDLCQYLHKLKFGRDKYNCSAEWQYLENDIDYIAHKNEHEIHIADICASALHKAIEPKRHRMTDDRFQRNLLPIVYRKNGKAYGLKLFPNREIASMRNGGDLQFLEFL